MATPDQSIFRQRAIDTYMQRQERHVVLRLVSPRMFLSLWLLLMLAVGGGVLVWSIQSPIMVQGKGLVVQPKAVKGKKAPAIVALLLLPPDQQANLRVGQPVTMSIMNANMTFNTTIQTLESGVMSPVDIGTQINVQLPLVQTLSGPAVVALAPIEPASQARTYLGSQAQVQVQIGSRSMLSLLPGYGYVAPFIDSIGAWIRNIRQTFGF